MWKNASLKPEDVTFKGDFLLQTVNRLQMDNF